MRGQARKRSQQSTMDLRSMQNDEVVVVKDDASLSVLGGGRALAQILKSALYFDVYIVNILGR
jgi:hypothetical protein